MKMSLIRAVVIALFAGSVLSSCVASYHDEPRRHRDRHHHHHYDHYDRHY